jgi:hypothetical protein
LPRANHFAPHNICLLKHKNNAKQNDFHSRRAFPIVLRRKHWPVDSSNQICSSKK